MPRKKVIPTPISSSTQPATTESILLPADSSTSSIMGKYPYFYAWDREFATCLNCQRVVTWSDFYRHMESDYGSRMLFEISSGFLFDGPHIYRCNFCGVIGCDDVRICCDDPDCDSWCNA